MRSRILRRAQAAFLVRFVRLAATLRECTPYMAGEVFHTGFGPFVQAAYDNRKLIASAAKVRLAWRIHGLIASAPSSVS